MFIVRPFAERDRPFLESIYRDCHAEAAWLPAKVRGRSDFSQDTKGETILVAVGGDDEPQGFVSVWAPQSFIHHLYVRSSSRRIGIGEALIESLAARIPRPWRLKCLRANSEATAFYLARGWSEISSGDSDDGPFAVLERTR